MSEVVGRHTVHVEFYLKLPPSAGGKCNIVVSHGCPRKERRRASSNRALRRSVVESDPEGVFQLDFNGPLDRSLSPAVTESTNSTAAPRRRPPKSATVSRRSRRSRVLDIGGTRGQPDEDDADEEG